MNERIKALLNVCGMPNEDLMEIYSDTNKTFYMEQFAELIVQEMCNVLDREQWNIGRDWICDDGTRIIPKVKEHFGVEE